jgi:TPP-dependent 2-oxoacid decarboxylase
MDIKTETFKTMSEDQLREVERRLLALRKERHSLYIKPQIDQHVKPIQKKVIGPLKAKHIKPINDTLKEVRKCLGTDTKTKQYWMVGDISLHRLGPMTKKEVTKLLKGKL